MRYLSERFRMGEPDALCLAGDHPGALVDDAAADQAAHPPAVWPPRASPPPPTPSSMACSEASGARPAGCGLRPPVIPVPGASRPSSAARTGAHWDAEALRDVVRDDVVATLSSPEAVLVI